VLTGLVTLAAVAGALLPIGGAGPPQPDLPAGPSISVSMTTRNDGRAVSLLDPAHPAWAHLAPTGAVAEVTATVDLRGTSIHQWVAHLDAPDAFQGITPADCRGDEEAPPQQVSCRFSVQAASGVNRLLFHFSADHDRVTADAEGTIVGGQFDWDAGWQVLDATGRWSAISQAGTISLPATLPSALRYVVTNTGDIPFRATNSCDERLVPAHAQLVCLERGVRPAQSLARDYQERLRLVDVVGATAEPDLQVSIRSFSGIFSLAAPSVTVGQRVEVSADGLPRDESFALQFRIDDEPLLVGTSTSSGGRARLSFPLPSTSPGTAHLEVIHDGLTIASLPFDVTRLPRKADAAPALWPWLAVAIAVIGVAVAVILLRALRSRRRRARSAPPNDAVPEDSRPAARARRR